MAKFSHDDCGCYAGSWPDGLMDKPVCFFHTYGFPISEAPEGWTPPPKPRPPYPVPDYVSFMGLPIPDWPADQCPTCNGPRAEQYGLCAACRTWSSPCP